MIKVSVVIPVYNVEKYIEKCIKSVINQTLKDIEIIVVNDGTKDNSIEIVKNITQKDKRVIIVEKENGGLSSARNEGLKFANGEYIYFLDSDDYIEVDMLEETYNMAKKYDCDFVRFKYVREILPDNKQIDVIDPLKEGKYDRKELVDKILNPMIGVLPEQTYMDFVNMAVWMNLYKHSVIKENNMKFLSEREYVSEDIIFNIDFYSYSKVCYVIDKPYYHYIENANSLTGRYRKDRFEKNIKLYHYLLDVLKNNDFCNDYKLRIDRAFINRVRECMKYELVRSDVGFLVKYRNLKSILKDKEVTTILKDYPIDKMAFSYKMICISMKYKYGLLLSVIYFLTKKI